MAAPFILRLDESIVRDLDALAARMGRSRDQVVEHAIADFVALQRLTFEAEARRQSLAIAERARDPRTDEYASLAELDALFDADHFASEWTA